MFSFLARRSPATGGFRRAFCTEISEESKAELMNFLKAASRPKMGLGKAKQSSGQSALDLTKQARALDDLDLPGLLRLSSTDLKKREVPCQVGVAPKTTALTIWPPAPSSHAQPSRARNTGAQASAAIHQQSPPRIRCSDGCGGRIDPHALEEVERTAVRHVLLWML